MNSKIKEYGIIFLEYDDLKIKLDEQSIDPFLTHNSNNFENLQFILIVSKPKIFSYFPQSEFLRRIKLHMSEEFYYPHLIFNHKIDKRLWRTNIIQNKINLYEKVGIYNASFIYYGNGNKVYYQPKISIQNNWTY